MKYLRKFSLIKESEEEQWIRDILLELEHEGFNIEINTAVRLDEECSLFSIDISKGYKKKVHDVSPKSNQLFKLEDIYDVYLTLEGYLSEGGYLITEVLASVWVEGDIKFYSIKDNIKGYEEGKWNLFSKNMIRFRIRIDTMNSTNV